MVGGRGGVSESILSTHRSLSFGTIVWSFRYVSLMSSGFYHSVPSVQFGVKERWPSAYQGGENSNSPCSVMLDAFTL